MDITTTIIPLITVIICLVLISSLLYVGLRTDDRPIELEHRDVTEWKRTSDLEDEFTQWKNEAEDDRTDTSFVV